MKIPMSAIIDRTDLTAVEKLSLIQFITGNHGQMFKDVEPGQLRALLERFRELNILTRYIKGRKHHYRLNPPDQWTVDMTMDLPKARRKLRVTGARTAEE